MSKDFSPGQWATEHFVIGDDDEGGDKVRMVVIMSKEIFLDRKHFPCHR